MLTATILLTEPRKDAEKAIIAGFASVADEDHLKKVYKMSAAAWRPLSANLGTCHLMQPARKIYVSDTVSQNLLLIGGTLKKPATSSIYVIPY